MLNSLYLKLGIGLVVIVAIGALWMRGNHWQAKYTAEHNSLILFTERVKSKSAEIQRNALANARRIETEQNRISQESSREYQTRLAELRARVDRMRVSGAGADRSRSDLPVVAIAASGSDAAASQDRLPPADAVIATETAIRLEELQGWVRQQVAVQR